MRKESFDDLSGFIDRKSSSPELKFFVSTKAMLRHQKERFYQTSKRGDLGEIKVFMLEGVLRLPNGVSNTPRGRDSSYFDFILAFGLNWDCFEANFGLSLRWFLCHVMACFVALIWTVLVAGFVVLLGMGLGHV